MNINDYDTPAPTFEEEYAPRDKASQIAAAKHNTRRALGAAPDAPAARPSIDPRIVGAIGLVMVVSVFALALSQFSTSGPLVIPPTDVPAQTIKHAQEGQQQPRTAPTAIPAPRYASIPAYAAPDGLVLGPIETTRAIVPVAHFGTGWIQADVAGSGRIWLRARDLPSVALVGPDLAPPQTGRGPGVVEQRAVWTAQEQPAETGEKDVPARTKARRAAMTRLNLPPPAR